MATYSQEMSLQTDSDHQTGRRRSPCPRAQLPASLCCARAPLLRDSQEVVRPSQNERSLLRFGLPNSGRMVLATDRRKPAQVFLGALALADSITFAACRVGTEFRRLATINAVYMGLLSLEIGHVWAPAAVSGRLPVLAFETLQRAQRSHCAADGEAIGRAKLLALRRVHQSNEKAPRDLACYQSLVEPAEIRVIQPSPLEACVTKQAKVAVVVESPAEPPIGANAILCAPQLPLEQQIRRSMGGQCSSKAHPNRRNCTQRLISQILHPQNSIIRPHARYRRAGAEQQTPDASRPSITAGQKLRAPPHDNDLTRPNPDVCLTLISRLTRASTA